MSSPTKFNWLIVAVVVLAAVNLVTLGFLWFGRRNGPPPRHDARQFLVSELQLNGAQTAQFDSLRKIHFGTVDSLREEVHHLKDELFARLSQPGDSGSMQITRRIGEAQTAIERSTFEHFHSLRQICSPVQQKKFDNIIQDVLRNMGGGQRPPPPPQPPHP